jgi:cytoskeletal protein CcmA (bactofilin family)
VRPAWFFSFLAQFNLSILVFVSVRSQPHRFDLPISETILPLPLCKLTSARSIALELLMATRRYKMTLSDLNMATKLGGLVGKKEHDHTKRSDTPVRMLRAGNEDITIGENSVLEGSFDTQGAMFVDGAAINVDLRAAQLSIGGTGRVEGQASVLRAEIAGLFDGVLECSGEVILRSSSRISGEIRCAKLVTHRGAVIAAQVHIIADEDGAEDKAGGFAALRPGMGPLRFWSRRRVRKIIPMAYGALLMLGAVGIGSLVL